MTEHRLQRQDQSDPSEVRQLANMRCHQILTGACNASTDCFAVGTVFGVPFTVSANIKYHTMCLQFVTLLLKIRSI